MTFEVRITIETEEDMHFLGEWFRRKHAGTVTALPASVEAEGAVWSDDQIDRMWSGVTPGFKDIVRGILEGHGVMTDLLQHLGIDNLAFGGRLSSMGHQANRYPELRTIQDERPFVTWETTGDGYVYKLPPEVEARLREVLGL